MSRQPDGQPATGFGVPSLFGPRNAETFGKMAEALEQTGYGALADKVAEKPFRIVHWSCVPWLHGFLVGFGNIDNDYR